MSAIPPRPVRDPLTEIRFRFLGKVLATFSHELKNHLAVIKESNGLVGDLVGMGSRAPSGPEASRAAVEAVERQVGRTLSLIRHFNRFAHRMDTPSVVYRPAEAIEELTVLIQRLASQARVALSGGFAAAGGEVRGDPALLQLVVFCLLDRLIRAAPPGSTIAVEVSVGRGRARVDIRPDGGFAPGGEEAFCSPEELEGLLDQLGGELERLGGIWRLNFVDKRTPDGVN